MTAGANAIQVPYFQYLSHRKEPFGEQVFYWLHWQEAGVPGRVQVIVDFAGAREITSFFLKAALSGEIPPPVRLPHLDLHCGAAEVTIKAAGPTGSKTIVFGRALYSTMCCAVAMSGLAIKEVGGNATAFPDLAGHPLALDLAARAAHDEIRDLPAFHVLREHPALRPLAGEALATPVLA
jgi:hypothetical protein